MADEGNYFLKWTPIKMLKKTPVILILLFIFYFGKRFDGDLFAQPAWVLSGAPIGDTSVSQYPATLFTLTYPISGENVTATSFTGTPDGAHIYFVGAIPSVVTGITGLAGNDRYFGVFVAGGTTPSYEIAYDYSGNGNITGPLNCSMFKRIANDDSPWVSAGAALNIPAQTYALTGETSRGEYILANRLPFANAGLDTTICPGALGAIGAPGLAGYTYSWSPATGLSSSTVANPTVTINTPQTYILIVDTAGCSDLDTVNVNMAPLPEVNFYASSVCKNQPTIFTDSTQGNILSWQWNFGDANISTVQNPANTYTTCGTFSSKLVATNTIGCKDSLTKIVTVNCLPSVNFISTIICLNDSTFFTDSSDSPSGSIVNWNWDFGDGSPTDINQNPTHLYSTCGNFNVKLIATSDNGCVDSITKAVTVYCLPIVNSGLDDTICPGGNYTLQVTPNGSGYSYVWNESTNPGFSTLFNPTVTPVITNTYSVILTDSNGCAGSDSTIIYVDTPMSLSQTAINISCNGVCDGQASVIATGGTAPYLYTWTGGCTNSNCTNLCPGSYTITVTDSITCIATDTVIITEPLVLTASVVSFMDASCNGNNDGTATANASGGVAPYSFSWSSGSIVTTANNLSAGSYTVTVTDSNSCVSLDSINIQQPLPLSIATTSIPAICTSTTGSITATATGGTSPYAYSWSSGGTTATEDSLATGSYTVTVTDSNMCTQITSLAIASDNPLTLISSSTPTACDTATGIATVIPGNGTQPYTYTWTSTPSQTTSTATGLDVGSYTVTVNDSNGCIQSQSISILPETGPTVVVAASPTTITLGDNTQLVAAGTGIYSWTPATGLSCTTCQTPVASPSETTTYCVTLSDTSSCTDTACITIVVDIPCGKLEVPTAFSPNNDGRNDLLILQGLDKCVSTFSFMIFDRWGEKIFETNNIASGWDGTFRSKPLNSAVFIYYIDATFISGEHVLKKGNISLIR